MNTPGWYKDWSESDAGRYWNLLTHLLGWERENMSRVQLMLHTEGTHYQMTALLRGLTSTGGDYTLELEYTTTENGVAAVRAQIEFTPMALGWGSRGFQTAHTYDTTSFEREVHSMIVWMRRGEVGDLL